MMEGDIAPNPYDPAPTYRPISNRRVRMLIYAFSLGCMGSFLFGYWVAKQRIKPIIIDVYIDSRIPPQNSASRAGD